MIEVKRKMLLKCVKCGSTDFLIKTEDHGGYPTASITSITCLKCAHEVDLKDLTFKTIPLEEEAL